MMDAEGYGDIYQQMNMEMYEYKSGTLFKS